MLKAIKIRLYPDPEQLDYINRLIGSSRFVFNKLLEYKSSEYKVGNKLTFSDLGKKLTSMKTDPGTTWLMGSHSKVLQQSMIDLNTAFKNFFGGAGYPKFKSKNRNKNSCRFPVDAISGVKGNRINIIRPLAGIHFKCSRGDESYLNKHQGQMKSGTLSVSKSGEVYFSVLIDRPNKKLKAPTFVILGIDVGIKDFVTTSSGDTFKNIKIKRNNKAKLAKLHKEVSRKIKGSENRAKAKLKLAKFYNRLNNTKENYLHGVVNDLLNDNQVIAVEDLNISGMMKNHKLARSIQELSLFRFKELLTYKASWYGREVVTIDRWFPSSKRCSDCGWIKSDLTLNDREWVCEDCGVVHDRDINAAINIREEGKRIKNIKLGLSSPEVTFVESSPLGSQGSKNQIVMCV